MQNQDKNKDRRWRTERKKNKERRCRMKGEKTNAGDPGARQKAKRGDSD